MKFEIIIVSGRNKNSSDFSGTITIKYMATNKWIIINSQDDLMSFSDEWIFRLTNTIEKITNTVK